MLIDHLLDDESNGADLKAKVAEAWREFAGQLGAALPTLPIGATLDITLDPTHSGTGDAVYAVRVEVTADALIATAVSNAELPAAYRLNRDAVAALVALGWAPPGVVDGSGEAFGVRATAGDAVRLGALLARTLRDVYGAPHPAFLTYLAHTERDKVVPLAPLGTARSLDAVVDPDGDGIVDFQDTDDPGLAHLLDDSDEMSLDEKVRTVVARLMKTSADGLAIDPDGDINIRAGSAMVFVRVRDNPPLVDVFSPILTEVNATEKLYVKLSELTNRMPIGRLYCTNDAVWASVPVFGRDFQPTHLMLAVQVMTGLADELDDRLHGEFGGKRFFGEGDKPTTRTDDQRTGMYL